MDVSGPLDLSGPWRATESNAELRNRFMEPALDDRGWAVLEVPGHWRSSAAFAASDGPVLYRRAFDTPLPQPGQRAFVGFEGIFYDGDVWLDGTYLGTTQGYFVHHQFEVTGQLRDAEQHLLAVEVGCPAGGGGGTRRAVTGVFADLEGNPGGLWRPVRLVTTGPVRLARTRVLCTEATEQRGRLVVALTLDAAVEAIPDRRGEPLPVRLALRVDDDRGRVLAERTRDVSLADGENHLSVDLDVDEPPRWWPRSMGAQPLCTLTVRAEVADSVSDELTVRTGFREVRTRRLELTVNGEPMFVRGSSQGPVRSALADARPDDFRRVVELALEANLDLLRVHEHVSRPELYDAADEAGLLLWQDLPLRGRYARTARGQATGQARAMVDLLGHHPSIAMWCAHDAPYRAQKHEATTMRRIRGGAARRASMLLPSWNKDVLDRSVARALRRADPTRAVLAHSGVPPGPITVVSDSHLVGGWHDEALDGLAPIAETFPRLVRFVSAFGTASAPESDGLAAPDRWPDVEWVRSVSAGPYGDPTLADVVPPDAAPSYEAWAATTREHQAALVQLATEDLRRLRGRPTTGFCHFCFADGAPAVSCSVLDHRHVPKPAYAALRDACRPVVAMLEPRSGAVHVVNDGDRDLENAIVRVHDGRTVHRAWSGDVPARAVVYVGRLPEIAEAGQDLLATLEHPDVGTVDNRYPVSLLQAVARGARGRRLSMLKRASAG